MKIIKIVYFVAFILFFVQGVLYATENVEPTAFSASLETFLLSAWVVIAYRNLKTNVDQ